MSLWVQSSDGTMLLDVRSGALFLLWNGDYDGYEGEVRAYGPLGGYSDAEGLARTECTVFQGTEAECRAVFDQIRQTVCHPCLTFGSGTKCAAESPDRAQDYPDAGLDELPY